MKYFYRMLLSILVCLLASMLMNSAAFAQSTTGTLAKSEFISPKQSIASSAAGNSASDSTQQRSRNRASNVSKPINQETTQAIRVVLGLSLIAVLPGLLICMTAFLRIVIVLSMLRHAIGMPETPPNTALIGLALFMTLFTMSPVLTEVNNAAFQPFLSGSMSVEEAYKLGSAPLRSFMIKQTREQDLALMIELAKVPVPASVDEVSNLQLIPAFMLSELRIAFQIGFLIFLPFLLIDIIVSSILMALGMMMMPPTTISLPLKILMFVLIDGWALLLKALLGSFK